MYISIHALRVEGDFCFTYTETLEAISIHALRVEGDAMKQKSKAVSTNFYPRPPGGGRQSSRFKR